MSSTLTSLLVRAVHVAQTAAGAYGLYLSSVAIPRLRQYEDTTEKAAKYSSTAEQQLHKTRATQASAATSVRCPLFVLVWLL